MHKSAVALLVTSLLAGNAGWTAPHPESFQLPRHGELRLAIPEGWVSKLSQPPGEVPPTIALRAKAGQPFEVMITPFWRKGEDGKIYDSALREQTESAAAKAQPQAAEAKLTLKEISGTEGRGYYFTATDRAPKPGEYKNMAQGMLRLGDFALAFTVLSNDGQADVVADAMQLLSTATHK
jgi:hypothetical protein